MGFLPWRAYTTCRCWRVLPERKRDCKFDISNASPLSEQTEVLLSGLSHISSGGLGATLLVAVWKHEKKKNRNKESVGKMSTEKSCCQKSKTKHHENHNLSHFLSLGCRHLLIQSFLVSGLFTSSLQ